MALALVSQKSSDFGSPGSQKKTSAQNQTTQTPPRWQVLFPHVVTVLDLKQLVMGSFLHKFAFSRPNRKETSNGKFAPHLHAEQ